MPHRLFIGLVALTLVFSVTSPLRAAQPPKLSAPILPMAWDHDTCMATDTGEIRCWGDSSRSQLGADMTNTPTATCSTLPQLTKPTLLAPANNDTLSTIAPLYQFDIGADMIATNMWLYIDIASDPGFSAQVERLGYYFGNRTASTGSYRFSRNLPAGQRFYWRAGLVCQEGTPGTYRHGPYSDTWQFVSGSGGTLPLAPQLVSPADGSLVLAGKPTLSWLSVPDGVEYLPRWQKMGTSGYGYNWGTALQYTLGYDLTLGASYDWKVAALNDHGIGPDSPTRHFTVGQQTTLINPDGGALAYVDSQGSLTNFQFPEGAVDQPTDVTIILTTPPTTPEGLSWAEHAFILEASQGGQAVPGLVFGKAVTVIINYTDADLVGMPGDSLKLMYWDEVLKQWKDAACGPYNRRPVENLLSVPICHLTLFSLFGVYPYHTYLPLVVR